VTVHRSYRSLESGFLFESPSTYRCPSPSGRPGQTSGKPRCIVVHLHSTERATQLAPSVPRLRGIRDGKRRAMRRGTRADRRFPPATIFAKAADTFASVISRIPLNRLASKALHESMHGKWPNRCSFASGCARHGREESGLPERKTRSRDRPRHGSRSCRVNASPTRHDDKIVINGVIVSPQPTAPARIIGVMLSASVLP